jgi:phosphoribosylanthranilate isomerase
MPLKTLVKVGNITNLSDARYCAGMGVDFLGFNVIEGQPQYIPVKTFQDIRGWVSGPRVVAEIYGYQNDVAFEDILSSYAPDLIECSFSEFQVLKSKTQLPFLVKVSAEEVKAIGNDSSVQYLIIDQADLTKIDSASSTPLLVVLQDKIHLDAIVQSGNVKGVVLIGSSEIRPGFKEYDMADVLEALEVD